MERSGGLIYKDYEMLLKKHLDNMGVIQDKLKQIDADDPAYEMIEALYLELGHTLDEIAKLYKLIEEKEQQAETIEELKEEKEQQAETIEELKEKKEDAQLLVKRYREDKQHLVALLEFRDNENEQLREEVNRLTRWMETLQRNFKVILSSWRWRLGGIMVKLAGFLLFRKTKPVNANQMLQIFNSFENKKNKAFVKVQDHSEIARTNDQDIYLLKGWLNELHKKTNRLLQSRRWKFMHTLGNLVPFSKYRSKMPKQVCKMKAVFAEFESWIPGKEDDLQKLGNWIEQYEKHYQSLLRSKRWRISDKFFSLVNLLLFRRQEKLATKVIDQVLAQYHKWRKDYYRGR